MRFDNRQNFGFQQFFRSARKSGKDNVLPHRPPLRTGRATFTASRLKPFIMFLLKNTALLLSFPGNELDDDNLDAVTIQVGERDNHN